VGLSSETTSPPSDPWEPWIAQAAESLSTTLSALGAATTTEAVRDLLEFASAPNADLALPVHRWAAQAHRPADAFAGEVASGLALGPPFLAARADGAYVNLTIEPAVVLQKTLQLALDLGHDFGRAPTAGPKVCIEHTSANPTGPLHVGRVRNAIIGDTFARAARASGSDVTTQYYVDDMGRQAAMITWLWTRPRSEWPSEVRASVDGLETPGEKVDHWRGRPYPALSALAKKDPSVAGAIAEFVQTIESGSAPPEHRRIAEEVLGAMVASLARLGISYDGFVWESDLVQDGSVARVVERLRAAPHAVQEENGAWAIDTAGYGLPKESTRVVFQRANGVSLYVTRDVAYHLRKFSQFARVVDVLGQDHQLHARTLNALLEEVGEARRPEYILYQDIHAPGGGRMSTRGGSAVWLDDLMDEAFDRARAEVVKRRDDLAAADIDRIAEAVASAAVRFHIVRVAPDKPVRFRWEDALSFEGKSGPFVQYAYARATSVLRKGGAEAPPYPYDAAKLTDPDELAVVRTISRWPRTVAYTARTGHVHTLASYAHELADRFNRFYHAVPVLTSGDARPSRIALVAAVRQTLGNALDLLGIPVLETM
jgi:arginyl-tRNA synthetase